MTTITINWLWLGGFVLYCVVSAVVEVIVDRSLGVKERLADLPAWKRACHEALYFGGGFLFYALFFK